ncbi:cbb3-type cytochrome oxidase assembly protein CcoS [Frateuria sp. YIM B11624]|uniref:cbb3-type cytochrome oxidase assembly protein CcoS n=1 Tax=Frateuria sp. YIM B11624 TaxID=3143185 RepID=UPI003C720233
MNILLVLIPVTGLIVVVAVALFFWAANHQQFDDLDSPAVLPLMEDETVAAPAADEAPASQEIPPESKGDTP